MEIALFMKSDFGKSTQVTDGIGSAGTTVFSRDGTCFYQYYIGLGNSGLRLLMTVRIPAVFMLIAKQTPSFAAQSDEEVVKDEDEVGKMQNTEHEC
ncbi:hypothetical protein CS542_07570 [Pedobacter sp. IW39]|nr:hypothetical protein CS542_07570 [Pedobacter sp. IW39]